MYYRVTDPNGKNHRFSCVDSFSAKYNLLSRDVLQLVNDNITAYKGWRNGWYQGVYEPTGTVKISEYTINRICKLYPSCTPKEIASRLDISIHTVVKYLKIKGIYAPLVNYSKITDERIVEMLSLYPQFTPTQIGIKVGIGHKTVVKYLKAANVYVPKRTRKQGVLTRDISPRIFHGHY